MKKLSSLLTLIFPVMMFAQSVAINTDGAQPNNTAILDIKSNSKGLLAPRMTTAQRTGIVSPAIGLTVFDTETFSYWVYRGDVNGNWAELQHNYQNFWGTSGANIFNTNNGNIGIGTNIPSEKLAINATNPTIDFMNAGTSKGYVQANGSNMRIGTYANNTTGKLVFTTKAVDRMWIDETGRVGIGTATPSSALTINGTNPILQFKNGDVDKGFVQISNNDMKIGTNLSNTDGLLIIRTAGADRLFINKNGQVGIGTNDLWNNASLTIAGGTDSTSNNINYLHNDTTFFQTKIDRYQTSQNFWGNYDINGFIGTGLHVNNYSSVCIGNTKIVPGYRLSVWGDVVAPEYTTLPLANWPDYVFGPAYKLKPLAEVKAFIVENKHLPNIPSASEIEKSGIKLGDMSKKLMEKVEELTLYVIQLQEQINELKKSK